MVGGSGLGSGTARPGHGGIPHCLVIGDEGKRGERDEGCRLKRES